MTDYRVETKIRNGRILRALDALSETPSSFAKKHGLQITVMCGLVAMTRRPKLRDGMWRPEIIALAEATNTMPSDFFTARQLEGFKKTKASADVSEQSIQLIANERERLAIEAADPEQNYAVKEIANELFRWLMQKNPRQALAVKMNIMGGATLDEVGEALGVSGPRARQIVEKGKREMRRHAQRQNIAAAVL